MWMADEFWRILTFYVQLLYRSFFREAVFHSGRDLFFQICSQVLFRLLQVLFTIKAHLQDSVSMYLTGSLCVCGTEKMTTLMMWPSWLESTWGRRTLSSSPPRLALCSSPARISLSSPLTLSSVGSFAQVKQHRFDLAQLYTTFDLLS